MSQKSPDPSQLTVPPSSNPPPPVLFWCPAVFTGRRLSQMELNHVAGHRDRKQKRLILQHKRLHLIWSPTV